MAGVVIVLTSLHVALAALGIGFLWRLVIVQPFSMLFCILALKAAE